MLQRIVESRFDSKMITFKCKDCLDIPFYRQKIELQLIDCLTFDIVYLSIIADKTIKSVPETK